jgi:hypothetical protein
MVVAVLAACTRVSPRRQIEQTRDLPADVERWRQEARGILSDGRETLQTFEVYAAFRVGIAERSERRAATDLVWDPPSSAAWDEATHVARGLHGRAENLFNTVANAGFDSALWRQRRDLADATSGLLDLGDALRAYRDRVDGLPPGGDGTEAWDLIDRAWARWDAGASRWGMSHAESISCTGN